MHVVCIIGIHKFQIWHGDDGVQKGIKTNGLCGMELQVFVMLSDKQFHKSHLDQYFQICQLIQSVQKILLD